MNGGVYLSSSEVKLTNYSMIDLDNLAKQLIPHYSKFRVSERLLFTGHSHQAWPDVTMDGLKEYFDVSAEQVDKKWDIAFEKTEKLRSYLRNFYDDPNGFYCREESTHVLFVSWLSSLDLKNKPKIITTGAEFHAFFRQLHRLEEEGLDVNYIPINPDEDFAQRVIASMDDSTSAVMLSRIYFESSFVNTHLTEIARAARAKNIPVLIDDYHGTNVKPISLSEADLEDCFILIGGYKYLQWGEANCFLRFPKSCELRPAITGWFSSFSTLDKPRTMEPTQYDVSDQRFASGTYDSVSQFRAAKAVDFYESHGLTPEVLQYLYEEKVSLLKESFKAKKFATENIRLTIDETPDKTGGFMSLTSPKARDIRAILLERDVFTDARDQILRFGPAPYTTSKQIHEAMDELEKVYREIF